MDPREFQNDFDPDISRLPVSGPSLDDLDNRLLLGRERCPACESLFIAPLRYIFDSRMTRRYLLRVCLDCKTVWNPPLLLDSPENVTATSEEFPVHAHIHKMDRNTKMAELFFDEIMAMEKFDSVLEIGCGIGTTLKVAADRGMRVRGYDINQGAVDKGRALFDLPLFAETWSSDATRESYGLVLCILVLEHLAWPLSLIHELAKYGKREKAVLFVSVPRFLRIYWGHLLEADPRNKNRIFCYSEGHFTHFSEEGLEAAFRKYGCKVYAYSVKNSWGGILCDFR